MDNSTTAPNPAAIQASNEDKLTKLKAKLEQKKKKLEEKRRKEEEAASTSSPVPPQSNQGPTTATSTTTQAERNAIRFAKNLATASTNDHPAPSDVATTVPSNREELENAVSLVGTCMNMCPEEEVLRRERESDIQLLEKPMPGTIHPVGWTIRDTMVKRFRRSAADYKLDVPEWVRPPDILERVCGYLEEWVMVSSRYIFKHVLHLPLLQFYFY